MKTQISSVKQSIAFDKPAPDFELQDTHGNTIRLSNYRGTKNVVLALNRGFV